MVAGGCVDTTGALVVMGSVGGASVQSILSELIAHPWKVHEEADTDDHVSHGVIADTSSAEL